MAVILSSVCKSFPRFFQLLRLRCFSTASPAPHFMVKFLVKSCRLTTAEAAKACKPIAHLHSIDKPDAVISFMRSQGFGDAHLRRLITSVPHLLRVRVKKTLAPKLESLRSMGFSESDVIDTLVANPSIIFSSFSHCIIPKMRMWQTIFGSTEILIKHMQRSTRFFSSSTENVVSNIKFLREECGIPRERVYLFIRKNSRFIMQKTDALRGFAVRTKELGVPRESTMFLPTLHALGRIGRDNFEAKLKLMRTIGWSDSEFVSAMLKEPNFLTISQEALLRKIDFFLKKAGCSSSYIAERPRLLIHSLEKRIIPRVRVMEMLKSEGLWKHQLSTIVSINDKYFREKFVLCHKDKVPKLLDML